MATSLHAFGARELDIYGRTRSEVGEVGFIPFLYQGQYLDRETGYVVGFEIDDEILSRAYKVKNLDAIGDALAIDIDQLNNSTPIVTSINSQRTKIDPH